MAVLVSFSLHQATIWWRFAVNQCDPNLESTDASNLNHDAQWPDANVLTPFSVVILAPIRGNQSERSKFSLDQSESRIWPMWLMWRHNAHIWSWKFTWPIGIKNMHTQELNLHFSHSFNDRVKPGDKRDVCDLQMRSRPFYKSNNKSSSSPILS